MAKESKAVNDATAKLRAAESELKHAKQAHRDEFRSALAALCNDYGFRIEPTGDEGADLEINETYGRPVTIEEIPE